MGKYRSVSTAEKRAELEAKGEPWPVCDCHGEPKKWSATTFWPAGGSWKCRVARNEALRRYNQGEKGREARKRRTLRERLGLAPSSTARARNMHSRRDSAKIDQLISVLGFDPREVLDGS